MCHCVNSYNIDLFVFSPRTDAIKDQACFASIAEDVFENKIGTFLRNAPGKLVGQEKDVRPSDARSSGAGSSGAGSSDAGSSDATPTGQEAVE